MAMRKALMVGVVAGEGAKLSDVLHRFGFDPAESVETMNEAFQKVHHSHYDLLMVALEQLDTAQTSILERELRRSAGTSVIGTAPSSDPELILRALRAGIHEFLVRPINPTDLAGSLDRLTHRIIPDGKKGFVVAVYSGKGGLGVSTIATNLAFGFAHAQDDRRVALADLVIGAGDVRVLLNLKPSYDIADLVAKRERVDAEVLLSLLTPRTGGVWVLPASDKPETADVLDSHTTATTITQLRSHFGTTVLDCEHHLSERTVAALDAADRIVLVTQLSIAALRSTQRTLQLFDRLGYSKDKICIVVNRFHSDDVVSLHDAETVLERPITWRIPNDYHRCAEALTHGKAVVEDDPKSQLGETFIRLATKLSSAMAAAQQATPTPAPAPSQVTEPARPEHSGMGKLLHIGK